MRYLVRKTIDLSVMVEADNEVQATEQAKQLEQDMWDTESVCFEAEEDE